MKFYKQLLVLFLVLASFTTNAQRLNQLQRGTEENQILITKGDKFIPAYISLEETEQLLNLDSVKEDIQVNSTNITALENTAVKSVNGIFPINGNVSIQLTDYSGDIATLQQELEERASEINELFNELNTTNNAVTTIDESAVKSVNGVLPVNGNVSIVLTDYSGDISSLQSQLNAIKEDIQVNSTNITALENTAVKSVNGILPINGNVAIQLTDYSGDLADLQSQINALDLSTLTNANSITALENTSVKSVNGILPINGNVSIVLTDYSGDISNLQSQINSLTIDYNTLSDAVNSNTTAIAANSQWISDYVPPTPYNDAELRTLINYNRHFVDNYTPYDDTAIQTSIADNTTAIQTSVKSVNGIVPIDGNVTLPDNKMYDDTALTTAINEVDTKATANSQWISDYVPVFKFVRTNVVPVAFNFVEDGARYAYIGNGFGNKVGDHGVVSGGRSNYASAYAYASGLENKANKNYSSATGRGCIANGIAASSEMYYNTVNGRASKVWGWRNTLNSDYSTIVGGVDFQPRVPISEMAYVPQLSIWKPLKENTSGKYQIMVRDTSSLTDGMVQFINAESLDQTEDITSLQNQISGITTNATAIDSLEWKIAVNSEWIANYEASSGSFVEKENGNVKLYNDSFFGVKNISNGVTNAFSTVEEDKIAMWVKSENYNPNFPDQGRSRLQLNKDNIELNALNLPYSNSSHTIDLGSRYGLFSASENDYTTVEENNSNLKSFKINSLANSSFMAQTSDKFSFWAQNGIDVNTRSLFQMYGDRLNVYSQNINLSTNNNARSLEINDTAIVLRLRKGDGSYSSISLKEDGCTISGGWYFYDPETLQNRDLIALIKSLETRISQLENQK